MKNFLLISVFLGCLSMASAQSSSESSEFEPSSAVKWNYGGIYFGKISLFGEYQLKQKKSLTLGIGIPFRRTTTVEINDRDREAEMKSFSIMGGYRMYLGKKTMTGAYFEPYLKYLKNDASTVIDAELDGRSIDFATTSRYSGVGVGAQLGVQFMIVNRVVIDFFFLGPEANISSHDVVMRDISSPLPWTAAETADAQREINENIGDLPIIGKKIKVTVDPSSKTVSSNYDGFLPGLRFGLSIGVRL